MSLFKTITKIEDPPPMLRLTAQPYCAALLRSLTAQPYCAAFATSSRDGDFSDFDVFTVFFRDAGLVRGFAKVACHKITLWIFEPKFRGVLDFSQKIYFMRKVAPWKCGENGMGPDRIPPIQFA